MFYEQLETRVEEAARDALQSGCTGVEEGGRVHVKEVAAVGEHDCLRGKGAAVRGSRTLLGGKGTAVLWCPHAAVLF